MQLSPLIKWLQTFSSYPWAQMLRKIMVPVYDRMTSSVLSAAGAGLVITGAGSTTAKTGAAVTLVLCNGVIVSIPAATNMPVLVGTIAQNTFGGWVFFVDQAGALTSLFMNPGTTLALMTFPQFPIGKACLGFVYLNPTTAPFVGGTTLLDAASTNAVYVSTNDGFDPWCLIGGQLTNS